MDARRDADPGGRFICRREAHPGRKGYIYRLKKGGNPGTFNVSSGNGVADVGSTGGTGRGVAAYNTRFYTIAYTFLIAVELFMVLV